MPYLSSPKRLSANLLNVGQYQQGYPLAIILKNDRQKYYRSLEKADNGNTDDSARAHWRLSYEIRAPRGRPKKNFLETIFLFPDKSDIMKERLLCDLTAIKFYRPIATTTRDAKKISLFVKLKD